jgi:hypothetical protein
MSDQLKAILQLAGAPALKAVLLPHVYEVERSVMWESIPYDDLSHSQKVALSWAYALWRDERPPEDWVDPFHGFHEVDLETRTEILRAFATRHGFTHFEIDAHEPPLLPGGSEEARASALHRLAEHPRFMGFLDGLAHRRTTPENWNTGGLSGGQKAAVSWAYAIRQAKLPPENFRDPFEGFSVLDMDMQAFVLRVLAEANGFFQFEPTRTLNQAEKFYEKMRPKE